MTGQNCFVSDRRVWIPLPISQLQRGEVDDRSGCYGWVSVGDDPQFHVVLDKPMCAGWYRISGCLEALEGQLLEPYLYPEYGRGLTESSKIALRHVRGRSALDSIFCLRDQTQMLRFDPMACEGRFLLGDLRVQRLTGREALWLMLHQLMASLRRRQPNDAVRLATSVRELREFEGLEASLDWLQLRYENDPGALDELYREWIAQEKLQNYELDMGSIESPPLFTVVLLEHTNAKVPECLDSLRAQHYPHWELLVPGDHPALGHTSNDAVANGRIRVLPKTGTETALWIRQAAEEARGRYLMFVDAAGCLHEQALAGFAKFLRISPRARMLYGDEDDRDDEGFRHTPYFKPDWNPELLLAQDYVSGALMLDTDLVRTVMTGELQAGAEIYDLVLRCTEYLDDSQIVHVPLIVRHNVGGREATFPRSAATNLDGLSASARAVSAHLDRCGTRGTVEVAQHGVRVRYLPPSNSVYVDIVIPTRDRVDLLSKCMTSILERTTWPDFRVTIVDNGSQQPESISYLSSIGRHERVRVLDYDQPFNYSAINNFAASLSDADLLVLLNNDIEVITPDWLSELVSHAVQPGVGAVGAKLYYPDETIQHAGVILGVKGVAAHPYLRQHKDFPGQAGRAMLAQNLSAVTAACLAVRRLAFNEIGGFDETIAVAFNDIDFCLRLMAQGYRNVWTPYAELYHHESATRGYEDDPEKQARFASEVAIMRARWGELLDNDPAYNPNLSLSGNPFDVDPNRFFRFT